MTAPTKSPGGAFIRSPGGARAIGESAPPGDGCFTVIPEIYDDEAQTIVKESFEVTPVPLTRTHAYRWFWRDHPTNPALWQILQEIMTVRFYNRATPAGAPAYRFHINQTAGNAQLKWRDTGGTIRTTTGTGVVFASGAYGPIPATELNTCDGLGWPNASDIAFYDSIISPGTVYAQLVGNQKGATGETRTLIFDVSKAALGGEMIDQVIQWFFPLDDFLTPTSVTAIDLSAIPQQPFTPNL